MKKNRSQNELNQWIEEFLEYLNIEKKHRGSTDSLSNYVFYVYVCERPFTSVGITFNEIIAIETKLIKNTTNSI